jgi:hypothetical protein
VGVAVRSALLGGAVNLADCRVEVNRHGPAGGSRPERSRARGQGLGDPVELAQVAEAEVA